MNRTAVSILITCMPINVKQGPCWVQYDSEAKKSNQTLATQLTVKTWWHRKDAEFLQELQLFTLPQTIISLIFWLEISSRLGTDPSFFDYLQREEKTQLSIESQKNNFKKCGQERTKKRKQTNSRQSDSAPSHPRRCHFPHGPAPIYSGSVPTISKFQ